ncbi:hypothetical protein D3C86_1746740 [compost metagenome]
MASSNVFGSTLKTLMFKARSFSTDSTLMETPVMTSDALDAITASIFGFVMLPSFGFDLAASG